MGKGQRAHFEKYQPPLSSADILKPPPLDGIPPIYKPDSPPSKDTHELLEEAPMAVLITTYISYFILIVCGHIRDFFGMRFKPKNYAHLNTKNGYTPLNSGFDTFYHRRLYLRIRDVFNRPITNVPGRFLTLLDRVSNDYNKTFKYFYYCEANGLTNDRLTGETRKVLNLSSYNYLGFAQSEGPCADDVEECIRKYGVGMSSSRMDAGTTDLHVQTEKLVAKFLGQEDACLVSMGFATNSTTLPALVGKGCLIISDELNHASLVYGARVSRASIKVFKHNDALDLENVLRESIAQGQPRTHRPWKKILVVVEGLYSMEGTICNLPAIVELKKKYKFYLYLDEAHSVGALGPNGRGVCDYYGINPNNIDILMGTFTKSFGAAGGYLAGKKDLIDYIKYQCHSSIYAETITPPVVQQIFTSMSMIMGDICGDEGRCRIQQLAKNAEFFTQELRRMGFIVYGKDSPVIPLLLFHPAKIPAFSREMLNRGIAVVVVGYPATPIITSRVRFCLSAAHTRDDLEWALKQIDQVGDLLCLKVSRIHNKSI